jgi:hypothetical protein
MSFHRLFVLFVCVSLMTISRRSLLQTTAILPIVTLAGCSAFSESTPAPTQTPQYEQLSTTPLYRSDDIGLRVPDQIPTAEAPSNADLIVLHGAPAATVDQLVTWLTDQRAVALLGDSAQSTWKEWTRSETYRTAFETAGWSESNPEPHLIVATAAETDVTTNRYSWDGLPSNDEILAALADAMAERTTPTP